MKIVNHEEVINAIHSLTNVRVTWRSKDDNGSMQTRLCAPMDYGPSRRGRDTTPRYHFWDFESDSGKNHVLSLLASQIEAVVVVDSQFKPDDFVAWDTRTSPWFVARVSWGTKN